MGNKTSTVSSKFVLTSKYLQAQLHEKKNIGIQIQVANKILNSDFKPHLLREYNHALQTVVDVMESGSDLDGTSNSSVVSDYLGAKAPRWERLSKQYRQRKKGVRFLHKTGQLHRHIKRLFPQAHPSSISLLGKPKIIARRTDTYAVSANFSIQHKLGNKALTQYFNKSFTSGRVAYDVSLTKGNNSRIMFKLKMFESGYTSSKRSQPRRNFSGQIATTVGINARNPYLRGRKF